MAPPPKRKHGKKTLAEHMANIDCDDSSFVKLEMRHEPKLTREAIEPLIDMAFSPIEEVQRDAVSVIETLSQLNSVNGAPGRFEPA